MSCITVTSAVSAQCPAFISSSWTVEMWNAEVKASGEGGAPDQWTGNKSGRMAAKYEEKMDNKGKEPYEPDENSKLKPKKGDPGDPLICAAQCASC